MGANTGGYGGGVNWWKKNPCDLQVMYDRIDRQVLLCFTSILKNICYFFIFFPSLCSETDQECRVSDRFLTAQRPSRISGCSVHSHAWNVHR